MRFSLISKTLYDICNFIKKESEREKERNRWKETSRHFAHIPQSALIEGQYPGGSTKLRTI